MTGAGNIFSVSNTSSQIISGIAAWSPLQAIKAADHDQPDQSLGCGWAHRNRWLLRDPLMPDEASNTH